MPIYFLFAILLFDSQLRSLLISPGLTGLRWGSAAVLLSPFSMRFWSSFPPAARTTLLEARLRTTLRWSRLFSETSSDIARLFKFPNVQHIGEEQERRRSRWRSYWKSLQKKNWFNPAKPLRISLWDLLALYLHLRCFLWLQNSLLLFRPTIITLAIVVDEGKQGLYVVSLLLYIIYLF